MRRLALAAVVAASLTGATAQSAAADTLPTGPCAIQGAVFQEAGIQMVDLYIWPYYWTCRTLG